MLLAQVEQLKTQLAARKPIAPSSCVVRARVETRGESLVSIVTLSYTFRTTYPSTAVSLGGRRAFLVAAALDGVKAPLLDTGDDGYIAFIEQPGEHTLTLTLEVPVIGRGNKNELGFEIGLPRSAITTLGLAFPQGVKRVNLATRTPDPTQPAKVADVRRVPGLEVQHLASKDGYPLGPVDLLEVSWDLPAAVVHSSESLLTAEWDISAVLADGFVDTTAKLRLRGAARNWNVIVPSSADVSVDRASSPTAVRDPGTTPGPLQIPTLTRPTEPGKSTWKLELPVGSAASDWVVTAVHRLNRPKGTDPKFKGPYPIGPFTVAGVSRQTGTVKVTAAANTRLTFKHGPDLRKTDPTGIVDEELTTALFRLSSGPTGVNPPLGPILEFEAIPLRGRVSVKPTYRLRLTEAGWRVRAELRVRPVHAELDTLTIDVPAEWRGFEATPVELVEGVQAAKTELPRQIVTVKLTASHKQPFDLVLEATVPVSPTVREATVPLLRFPTAFEKDAQVVVIVPDGLEVRGSAREWEGDQPVGWGQPLTPVLDANGKAPKAVAAVTGKFEHGLARVDLAWHPYQPELTADVKAEVTVQERQVVVNQQVRVKAPDGFGRPIRFRGPVAAIAFNSKPTLDPHGGGEWSLMVGPDSGKELTLSTTFALPIPPRPPDDNGPWRIPVGLVWPIGTTRTDAAVRVWAGSSGGRAITTVPGPWREQPPEPSPDRDALPIASLVGSGSDLPLVIEIGKGHDSAAELWVERALIQAWTADDGTTMYRARFLLKRWMTATADIRLPAPLTGLNPEVLIDGKRVEPGPIHDSAGGIRPLRVPLPESRPGRLAALEVRYQLPPRRASDAAFLPPQIAAAAFVGPIRWEVSVPPGTVPLLLGGGRAEVRWRWWWGTVVPAGSETSESLDRWFRDGTGIDGEPAGVDSLVARQSAPALLRVYPISRVLLVIVCSLLVLVIELIVLRLPASVAPVVVAVLGGVIAIGAVFYPQPAAQVAGAAQPGQALVVLILAGYAAVRWIYRRRVTYLPGFTRTRMEVAPSGAVPTPLSARGRQAVNGSTGVAHPVDRAVD